MKYLFFIGMAIVLTRACTWSWMPCMSHWSVSPRKTAWNFAYGSNLNEGVRSRRQLSPCSLVPAQVHGWELTFDLRAVPYLEPAFATLRQAPLASNISVHGLCLELDRDGWLRLLQSEGVLNSFQIAELKLRNAELEDILQLASVTPASGKQGYCLAQVHVESYGHSGNLISPKVAYALAAADGARVTESSLKWPPSERYWRLMRNGAKQSRLDIDYRTFISSLPRYSPSTFALAALPAVAAASLQLDIGSPRKAKSEGKGSWPALRGPLRIARGSLETGVNVPPDSVWDAYCSTPRRDWLKILQQLIEDGYK